MRTLLTYVLASDESRFLPPFTGGVPRIMSGARGGFPPSVRCADTSPVNGGGNRVLVGYADITSAYGGGNLDSRRMRLQTARNPLREAA